MEQVFNTAGQFQTAGCAAAAGTFLLTVGAFAGPAAAQMPVPPAQSCLQLVEALASDESVGRDGVASEFNRASLRPDRLPAMMPARAAAVRSCNRRAEPVGSVTSGTPGFGGLYGVDPCPDTLTAGTHAGTDRAADLPDAAHDLRYVLDAAITGREVSATRLITVNTDAPVPVVPKAGDVTLSFPTVVAPGESVPVTHTGPLNAGDWIDIVTPGDDANMSGGWSWDYVGDTQVVLTAPPEEGEYTLRYIADDPQLGRVVLASDMLVVRAESAPTVDPTDIIYRCDGVGLAPCDIVLPEHDIAMTLLPGYGLTEPLIYTTPAGASAERPSFDVVRLSDGAVVVTVNARQPQAVYCQDGLAGDVMCVTDAVAEADGVVVAFVLASVGSAAMAVDLEALGNDEPGIAPGELQGVWFARLNTPGRADHEESFMLVELFQDVGTPEVFGYFVTAPEVGPARGLTGDITGRLHGDTLSLTLAASDGTPLMQFSGAASGDIDFVGDVAPVDGDSVATRLSRVAGPGEAWSGPPWMTGDSSGTDAAMQMGQTALAGLTADLTEEDRAVAEIMGALIGTVTDTAAPQQGTSSPNLVGLDAKPVDLQGLPAAALIELIVPFQVVTP